MPKLKDILGTNTPNATTSAEVAALKAKVTALENSLAKETTAITGRVKTLEDKPAFDPKTIEDAIASLVANEAVDDKAVAELEKALKALPVIDLSPYAKTADLKSYDDTKLKEDLTAAIARLTSLEEVKTIRSSNPPDLARDWHRWDFVVNDLAKWEVTVREWIRITKNSAMPVGLRVETMPPATDDNAEETSPGVFQNTVQGGAQITYKKTRSLSDIDQLTFPAGTYTNAAWIFLDSAKVKLGTYGGGAAIVPDATTLGQGFSSIPDDAKFVQYELTKADGTAVLYTYPMAKI